MKSRKYSFIITPKQGGEAISGEFSQRSLVMASVVISCLFLLSVYFTIGFLKSNIDRRKLKGLEKENVQLSSKLERLESTVGLLKGDISKIIQKDEDIRLVFDLAPLDPELRQVGIGGDEIENRTAGSALDLKTMALEQDIDMLRRQLELENASFEDLFTKVKSKREKLDHMPSIKPCEGRFSRGYGSQRDPFTGLIQQHNGVDFAAPRGTPIYAAAAGIIVQASYESGMGNTVEIDHGDGLKTVYGHMNKFNVRRGQRVDRYDIIGFVGSTGYSTGPHLHYEVHQYGRALNPNKFILENYLTNPEAVMAAI